MDKRDRFEELFHERLYDLKYTPGKEDWQKIARRIPQRKRIGYKRTSRAVAAVIALLLVVAGGLWFVGQEKSDGREITSGGILAKEEGIVDSSIVIAGLSPELTEEGQMREEMRETTGGSDKGDTAVSDKGGEIVGGNSENVIEDQALTAGPTQAERLATIAPRAEIVPQAPALPIRRAPRKWRIGMGSGNLGVAGLSSGSSGLPDQAFCDPGNPKPKPEEAQPATRAGSVSTVTSEATKIKHGYPFSFGIAVSRVLNEHWSVSSGVNYSFLRTRWRYEYNGGTAQTLRSHLVGIPLAVNYRLTDWQRPQCYLSAGVLAEVNVAGKLHKPGVVYRARIPGVLWTANARIGLSYPIVRFVSAYAEAGVCYYFNHRGYLEIIRSEHAFNLTGQIGFRLNF